MTVATPRRTRILTGPFVALEVAAAAIPDGERYRSSESSAMSALISFTQSPMSSISRFLRSESGATTAEYGIIIVVVAGIAIFVLSQLNGALNTLYGKFAGKVNDVN